MKTEKQKMLSGVLYDAQDEELAAERLRARKLLKALNDCEADNSELKDKIIGQLIPHAGKEFWLQPPFYCDYGYNIITGDQVFFNFNCIVLDVMKVEIGDRTLFGPNVQIYTATHPMDSGERAQGLEYARPIRIGDDVWIGGSAVICPGVTIGDRTVIGAGSVVTKDIPPEVFAAGNPCKVIRKLQDQKGNKFQTNDNGQTN